MGTGIEDGNHALLVGGVWASLSESLPRVIPTKVTAIADEHGNYTNRCLVERPSGVYEVEVRKLVDQQRPPS